MNSDEIRRRRIETLAQLERQQAQSAERPDPAKKEEKEEKHKSLPKTNSAGTSAPKPAPPGTSSAKTEQPQNQKPEVFHKPAPQPVRPQSKQLPSVAYVFGGPENEEHDWAKLDDLELDSLIWDRLTGEDKPPNALTYLMTSYGRLDSIAKALPDVARQVREIIVRLAVISATADEDEEIYAHLSDSLLAMASSNRLDPAFLNEFFTTLRDDEETFNQIVIDIFATFPKYKLGDRQLNDLHLTVEALLDIPEVAEVALEIPDSKSFEPNYFEKTAMGLVMAPCLADKGLSRLHQQHDVVHTPIPELVQLARDVQPVTQLLADTQFRIVKKLVRKSASIRRLVLNWFKAVLDSNHGQTAMNRSPEKVNNFGFMLNCLSVLLRLSEPFVRLDAALVNTELAKINSTYFANVVSYDISDETKLLASQDSPYNSQTKQEPLNFVTECFFLTVGFMHYGFSAAIQALEGSLRRSLNYIEAELANEEIGRRMRELPSTMRLLNETRIHSFLVDLKNEIAGTTAQIEQADLIQQSARFSAFTLAYAMYTSQGSPSEVTINIPWPNDPPEAYKSFPELMIESSLVVARHVMRTQEFMRNPLMIENSELLVNSCIFYMSSPRVLRNPYLRSKFVEILYFGGADIPLTNGSTIPGAFSTLFTTSETCQRYLLPALMSAFIDIEHTGRTSQFYEKFSVRELIAQVFKVLWRDPHYIRQLVSESTRDSEFFVQFVALLLSDATYLLDESLGKLLEVRNLQTELERPGNGVGASNGSGSRGTSRSVSRASSAAPGEDAMDVDTEGADENGEGARENSDAEDEPTDPASRLRSAESAARSLIHFAASSVDLLSTFTGSVPRIFSTPEIIDRFAVMLNYNLAALVGPKCRDLKVREPAKLGFHPRQLLTDLIVVYLNLRNEPPFPKSLAKDERSYRHENFLKAHQILSKYNLLSPVQLDQLQELADRTNVAWQEAQEEDEDFGDDIPDEYLDPLMFTVMENPVTLPTSRVNIDFSTIKTHLLSDQTDPFNRVPLKVEDVIPNPDLKREIEEYRRKKKEERKKA